jgi:hypothetical protein
MTNKEKMMEQDLQEQACWLLLAYESGLTTRVIDEEPSRPDQLSLFAESCE